MKQLTQLLPEDLRKELYELWEVSISDGSLFIVTEFIWLLSVLLDLDYLNKLSPTCCFFGRVSFSPPSCCRNFSGLIVIFLPISPFPLSP